MRRFPSIKKNSEFRTIYRNGRSCADQLFVLYAQPNGTGKNRLGVSVSKKIGNSVVRHRIVRLMREAFRLHATDMEQGYDLVVIARDPKAAESYAAAERSYLHLTERLRLRK